MTISSTSWHSTISCLLPPPSASNESICRRDRRLVSSSLTRNDHAAHELATQLRPGTTLRRGSPSYLDAWSCRDAIFMLAIARHALLPSCPSAQPRAHTHTHHTRIGTRDVGKSTSYCTVLYCTGLYWLAASTMKSTVPSFPDSGRWTNR